LINEGWAKVLAAQRVNAPYLHQFSTENYINFNPNVMTVIGEWRDAFLSGKRDINSDDDWQAYLAALDEVGYSKIIADLNEWMAAHE
jgi:hypothetical protein